MLRSLRGIVLLLIVFALLLVAGYAILRTSLPRVDGTLTVSGLAQEVRLERDANGVPRVVAGSQEDAWFGLGFVHAQDRLWQMEHRRLVATGRLASVVGADALQSDLLMSSLGLHAAGEATVEELSPRARGILQAYCDGINAFLDSRWGLLPPEFLLLGHRPRQWRPADVAAVEKLAAWERAGDWRHELARALLIAELPAGDVRALWPGYADAARAVPVSSAAYYRQLPLAELLTSLPAPAQQRASAWAVAGERAAGGEPLLAYDLRAPLDAPPLAYQVSLEAPGLQVAGVTIPGSPLLPFGRNERLAWALAGTEGDTQDLFLERVDPTEPGSYLTADGPTPFAQRAEIISVRGADEVEITLRSTGNGPVLSDLVLASGLGGGEGAESQHGLVLALAWTGLAAEDRTLQGGLDLPFSRDPDDLAGALRNLHEFHGVALYADADGNIGALPSGRRPQRAGDGSLPVPGWADRYRWTELRRSAGAAGAAGGEGLTIAVAGPHARGDKVAPARHDPSDVAARAIRLLGALDEHTVESFTRILWDRRSPAPDSLLPFILEARPDTAPARRAQAELLDWDGTMAAAEAAPLVFAHWYDEFERLVLADELGDGPASVIALRPAEFAGALDRLPQWCDDRRTPEPEDCRDIASRALRTAAARIGERHGRDPGEWRWASAQEAAHRHPLLGETWLAPWFAVGRTGGGDPFTLDAAGHGSSGAAPFRQDTGSVYRAVVDLSDPLGFHYLLPTGQSGNPLSPHHADMADDWRAERLLPLAPPQGRRVLNLEPRR